MTLGRYWSSAVCCTVVFSFMRPVAAEAPQEVLADWRAQDGVKDALSCRRAVVHILERLGDKGAALRSKARTRLTDVASEDARWAALYVQACERRRRTRLGRLLSTNPKFVFTKHCDLGGSHYAYTEGQSDAQNERHFVPGASLCVLAMEGLYGRIEILKDDRGGVIRDPDVSWDGTRIVFAWKKSLNEDDYHLYEMKLADRSIRQITFGLGYADYEGTYLPNGDLLFNSTRCVQTVDCWWTEVSTLFTCAPDGRFLRQVSFDQVHTNYPTVTWDGRVLYTRWDYNDRGQIFPQGLFQMHPDGTAQTEFYGNNSWFPTSILHARSIPGTQKVVAVFSGHHTIQKGWLGILDPARGRQEERGAQLVAPRRRTLPVHIDAYGQEGDQFQYPYPLSETEYVVAFKPAGSGVPFGIYWMDEEGQRELLVADPRISCNQPVPLAARRTAHVRPSLCDYHQSTGTFLLQDIYEGPGLQGIPRGTIKKLRVVKLEYRAAGIGHNINRGPAGGALASTPVSIDGTWDVKVVLGEAKVHDDGSAFFRVPARTPVYFQALDQNNHAVQTMRSWAQLQPGEFYACVGCHENKNSAPPVRRRPEALRTGVQELTPWYGPPRGFSFEREIQPILDRSCVRCHYLAQPERMVNPAGQNPAEFPSRPLNVQREKGPVPGPPSGIKPAFSLRGKPGSWSPAYRSLANRRVADWINIQESPAMLPPYHAGAARSRLITMLREGHYGVKLAAEEMDRIACWIDLLVPCFGDYTEGLSGDALERYNRYAAKRKAWQETEARNIQELTKSQYWGMPEDGMVPSGK